MTLRIYEVTITSLLYVLAEDADDAERIAERQCRIGDGEPIDSAAAEVITVTPEIGGSLPYVDYGVPERTIAEWLAQVPR